jgi:aminoglycoside phosphotransferase (APT) family kinase protein
MQTNFDFDVAQLADYLEDKVAGFKGPLTAEKFAGGQSNPTFKITAASGEYVLRRKPPGELRQVIDPVEKDFEKQFLDTAKAVFPHWQNLARLEGAHDMVQFLMKGMALSHMSVRKKARAKRVMTYLTAILYDIYQEANLIE